MAVSELNAKPERPSHNCTRSRRIDGVCSRYVVAEPLICTFLSGGPDMRKLIVAASIVVLPLAGSTACATKKMVRTSVGEVNEKVDAMGRSLEQTQERTRKNEKRISEVDEKVQAVD